MTTTGSLLIHRRGCPGDDVATRLAAMPRLQVLVRTCQSCGAVAIERIPEHAPRGREADTARTRRARPDQPKKGTDNE